METFLGVPARGWVALSIWILVLTVPWAYVLWFLRRIDQSGVERWGAKAPKAAGAESRSGGAEG